MDNRCGAKRMLNGLEKILKAHRRKIVQSKGLGAKRSHPVKSYQID